MSPQTIDAVRSLEVDLLGDEDVYLQILDSLADMVLVKGAHSRLLWANKAFRDYYAMDLEQLRELVDAPFNAPDHTQQYVADDLRVFTTGEPLDIPMEVVTRHDGVEGLFHTVKSAIRDEQGRVRLTVGVSRNIGETVHLREELLRNRDQLQRDRLSVFTAELPGFLFQLRPMSSTWGFSFVSARVDDYYGLTAAELMADPARWDARVDDADRVRAEIRASLAQAAVDADGQVRHVHRARGRDGAWRWMELLARAHHEADGSVTFYGYAHDVTARQQVEDEREQLIRQLKERNQEMEQFSYTISHDLKSPLVTIRGFLGGIEEDVRAGKQERALQDLARVRAAAEKMSRMLAELLELSRIGRAERLRSTFRVAEVVDEALELLAARLASSPASVVVDVGDVTLTAERTRIVQVFQNLVENAVKYLGPQPAPCVDVRCVADGDGVIITVADNGIGVAPAHHHRIFGLFDKLDPKSDGTGVGLALVKTIVEHHRGRVWVTSAGVGQGSTFHVWLPVR